jgi:hypothetical protein
LLELDRSLLDGDFPPVGRTATPAPFSFVVNDSSSAAAEDEGEDEDEVLES